MALSLSLVPSPATRCPARSLHSLPVVDQLTRASKPERSRWLRDCLDQTAESRRSGHNKAGVHRLAREDVHDVRVIGRTGRRSDRDCAWTWHRAARANQQLDAQIGFA
jgi:hypothetical protein